MNIADVLKEAYEQGKRDAQPEPCGDAVSIAINHAIIHFRDIIEATDPKEPYNGGFIDGLEFCISHLSTMSLVTPKAERRWIPCDWCAYNPPSSMDGKPCTVCPAVANPEPFQEEGEK